MCFGRPPSQPTLPEARPTPPKPEKTAENVVVGTNRLSQNETGGRKRTGQRQRRARRLGTAMLRIPLNPDQSTSDLRY